MRAAITPVGVGATVYLVAVAIHGYCNETQTRWDRGEFQVQLILPDNSRPMGFCDGTAEDIAELTALAEAEGAEVAIHRKRLKSGREVWTLGSEQTG